MYLNFKKKKKVTPANYSSIKFHLHLTSLEKLFRPLHLNSLPCNSSLNLSFTVFVIICNNLIL